MALFCVVYEIFNVEKYRDLEITVNVIESGTIRYTGYGFLLVFCSNFVPMNILRYLTLKMLWPWKPGYGSFKVIENVTIRYSA